MPTKVRKTFQFDSPAGHWQRNTITDQRTAQVNVRIDEERVTFTVVASYGGQPVTTTIEADYSVNKESLLYGVVTSSDTQLPEGAKALPLGVTWPEEDQLFSFRFRVDGDTLTVKDVRFPGLPKDAAQELADTFGGRYGVAPPAASVPQVPGAPTRPMRSVPKKSKSAPTPELKQDAPLPVITPSFDPVTPTLPIPSGTAPLPTLPPGGPAPSIPPVGPGPGAPTGPTVPTPSAPSLPDPVSPATGPGGAPSGPPTPPTPSGPGM
jgi:hypothetical protein